jgi:hypothetical protein
LTGELHLARGIQTPGSLTHLPARLNGIRNKKNEEDKRSAAVKNFYKYKKKSGEDSVKNSPQDALLQLILN